MTNQNQETQGGMQVFGHERFGKVRAIMIDGESWFVGKDITTSLGYKNGSRDLARHVDEEDRRNYRNGTSEINNRGITIINESGLYSLILSSKLPQAKIFKRWVTSEILPSIRKHGAYVTDDALENIVSSPGFTEALLEALAEENAKNLMLKGQVNGLTSKVSHLDSKVSHLEDEVDELAGKNLVLESERNHFGMRNVELLDKNQKLGERVLALEEVTDGLGEVIDTYEKEIENLSPKAQYFEKVLSSDDAVQVSIIAKDYGMSARVFNLLLHEMHIQYKIGNKGAWLLYQKYANEGYTKSKTFYRTDGECVIHSYWTQRGGGSDQD